MAVSPATDLDLDAFAATISGSVIRPGSADYEDARKVHALHNNRHPIVIVRAADAADVARTIALASESGIELAVRSGGHSVAGFGTSDGVVLDLSAMKGLDIDVERRIASVEAGVTAGEYTLAAAEHGLATPFGDTADVGIAGLTLGGGVGFLLRKHGLTIDHLLSVEVVMADGKVLTASESENADLFWAIRGGGGNFGVVTRLQFRLVPLGMTLSGALFMPLTREVIAGLVPAAKAAPEELTTITFVMGVPPLPFVPEEHHFKPSAIVMFVHASDDIAAGQAALDPFRALATPYAEAVIPMPYPGIFDFTTEAGKPTPGVVRALFVDDLDDAAVETIVARGSAPSSPRAMTQIRVLGGEMSRVPADATAFAHRAAGVLIALLTVFDDPAELAVHEAWTKAYFAELTPRARGAYANFLEVEGEDRIREAYPAATYQRLAEIKRRYDPTNLFRLNQNIPPAQQG